MTMKEINADEKDSMIYPHPTQARKYSSQKK